MKDTDLYEAMGKLTASVDGLSVRVTSCETKIDDLRETAFTQRGKFKIIGTIVVLVGMAVAGFIGSVASGWRGIGQ